MTQAIFTTVRNPFRDPTMRQNFDAAVKAYGVKHRNLFLADGARRVRGGYGSSFATYFWRGFDGEPLQRGEKQMVGYAFYRAGKDIAALSNSQETRRSQ